MKLNFKIFLPLLIVSLLRVALPVNAEQIITDTTLSRIHFGHFLFSIPDGWKNSIQDGVMMLVPSDLKTNELLSYVFLTPVTEPGFDNVIQETLTELAKDFKGTLMTEPALSQGASNNFLKEISGKSFKGWDYYKGYGHIKVPKPNDSYSDDVYEVNLFLVRINNRIERLVLISKDVRNGVKESTTARKPEYADVIKSFCFNLEFDDWKDSPYTIGKLTHKGISSVWSGLNYYINSPSVIFTSTLQNTFLIFFDNGQVYFNSKFPSKGLDGMNTLIEAEWNPRLWGTYTFQNNAGTITLSFSKISFTIDAGRLVVNYMKTDHNYSKLPGIENIFYNGTWCGSGEVYGSSACISFTSDGQFIDNGVVRAIEHSLNDYYVATPLNGVGNYQITNNTIIFHFKTGEIFKTAFIETSNKLSPEQISLGYENTVFTKK